MTPRVGWSFTEKRSSPVPVAIHFHSLPLFPRPLHPFHRALLQRHPLAASPALIPLRAAPVAIENKHTLVKRTLMLPVLKILLLPFHRQHVQANIQLSALHLLPPFLRRYPWAAKAPLPRVPPLVTIRPPSRLAPKGRR